MLAVVVAGELLVLVVEPLVVPVPAFEVEGVEEALGAELGAEAGAEFVDGDEDDWLWPLPASGSTYC